MSAASPPLVGEEEFFLVDVVQVAPGDVAAYLRTFEELGLPVMRRAGAVLESCRATADDLGVDVDIEVVWRLPGFVTWNRIRRDLVVDPVWHDWGRRAAALRRGGARRIMRPVTLGT